MKMVWSPLTTGGQSKLLLLLLLAGAKLPQYGVGFKTKSNMHAACLPLRNARNPKLNQSQAYKQIYQARSRDAQQTN
jgi:hypothetical protein